MSNATRFIGDIPTHYDSGLGPVIFAGFAEDLAARAAALHPRNVLELAAGTGIVTRQLRDQLPNDSSLTATDLNQPMLDVARSKFREDEIITFSPADAMSLDFPDASFDVIVCQFGVMFFPDKSATYREAMRVLKPGGTYFFNVWGSLDENPYARIGQGLAEEIFSADPPQFYKVPFSYWDPNGVLADLRSAGCDDCTVTTLSRRQQIPDVAAFTRGFVYGNPIIAEIEARGTVPAERVRERLEARYREAFGPEPLHMPLVAHVFAVKRSA